MKVKQNCFEHILIATEQNNNPKASLLGIKHPTKSKNTGIYYNIPPKPNQTINPRLILQKLPRELQTGLYFLPSITL